MEISRQEVVKSLAKRYSQAGKSKRKCSSIAQDYLNDNDADSYRQMIEREEAAKSRMQLILSIAYDLGDLNREVILTARKL